MDLRELIKAESVEQVLVYNRQGQEVLAYPKTDCTINTKVDLMDQLRGVSGAYYFYGQILGEIEGALRNAKMDLKKVIGLCYQENHQDLTRNKIRITEKMLESLINTNLQVIKSNKTLAELEGNKVKIDTILTALKLKQEGLIECLRRENRELKAINNLT